MHPFIAPRLRLAQSNKFMLILRGLLKVIGRNVGNQYLKLKYASQAEEKWVLLKSKLKPFLSK